jgi:hypothetical protein
MMMMKTCQMSIKQITQNRGERKVQDGRTQVQAKRRTHQQGKTTREQMAIFLGWWTRPISGVKWPMGVWCNGTF